jgi:uncharacterized membrane protein YhaH (DUF805 family)
VDLGFDVFAVNQMITTRRLAAEGASSNLLLLFLITLTRTVKSQEIFKLQSHTTLMAQVCKAQNALTHGAAKNVTISG